MEFKLSKYLVITDSSNETGTCIFFSTRTAQAVLVKPQLRDKILNRQWNILSDAELSFFQKIEIIVPAQENELLTILNRNRKAIADVKSLYHVIQPTAVCQLGCGYCGQTHTKGQLTDNISDKIVNRIENKLIEGSYERMAISWFGSEPLAGYPQIQYLAPQLINLAKKYDCDYTSNMVTNGLNLNLDTYLNLAKNLSVSRIEITLDGTPEYHDNRRYTKKGKPTFEQIFRNILSITNHPDYDKTRCPISIRCNVDAKNEEGVIPLMELLVEHNLQNKISHFYPAPIHSWGNDAHLIGLEKKAFAEKEILWYMKLIQLGFSLPQLIPNLEPIICLSVVPNNEVFDAFGNVYDCTETPYVDKYKGTEYILGNLNDNTITGERPLLGFYDQIEREDYDCSSCEMLPVCGGGCPKSWVEGISACPTNKFNIKEKLLLYLATKNGSSKIKESLSQNQYLASA